MLCKGISGANFSQRSYAIASLCAVGAMKSFHEWKQTQVRKVKLSEIRSNTMTKFRTMCSTYLNAADMYGLICECMWCLESSPRYLSLHQDGLWLLGIIELELDRGTGV